MKSRKDESLRLASELKAPRAKKATTAKEAEEMMNLFQETVVEPNEARMKDEALKKNDDPEGYSSGADSNITENVVATPSKIERKSPFPILVPGSASVRKDVSEKMSENLLSKKNFPIIG